MEYLTEKLLPSTYIISPFFLWGKGQGSKPRDAGKFAPSISEVTPPPPRAARVVIDVWIEKGRKNGILRGIVCKVLFCRAKINVIFSKVLPN